mmetsp:Transcript_17567/g.42239  ORF Transcript_17567/g.42239 Transcript_17567/m.42239 type:complete len:231 (+) Transcript_17567:2430-3122(+)
MVLPVFFQRVLLVQVLGIGVVDIVVLELLRVIVAVLQRQVDGLDVVRCWRYRRAAARGGSDDGIFERILVVNDGAYDRAALALVVDGGSGCTAALVAVVRVVCRSRVLVVNAIAPLVRAPIIAAIRRPAIVFSRRHLQPGLIDIACDLVVVQSEYAQSDLLLGTPLIIAGGTPLIVVVIVFQHEHAEPDVVFTIAFDVGIIAFAASRADIIRPLHAATMAMGSHIRAVPE